MSTDFFVPYTYFLEWSDGTKYYGVRYAKKCHPDDLLVSYFTSSKYVTDKIKTHGLPDKKVHKTFPGDAKKAQAYEHRALKILKAATRPDYLNKTDNKSIPAECNGSDKVKGKTYEEIYGAEKAAILRQNRSITSKNKKPTEWTDDMKEMVSKKYLGGGNPRAKSVSISFANEIVHFRCIKDAAVYLSDKTTYEQKSCEAAIRAKLNGRFTTVRHGFKPLYGCFSIL